MSSPSANPYQAPVVEAVARDPRQALKPPAIGLIVVSSLALVMNLLSLAGSVLILVLRIEMSSSGADEGSQPFQTTIAFRMLWAFASIAAAGLIIFGSIKMLSMKSYGVAIAACIVAMIPLISPCFVLGIPFGLWGLIVLLKSDVKAAFH